MKKIVFKLILLLYVCRIYGQDAVSFQMPPQAMADLLLAKQTPAVSVDSKAEWMLLMDRNSYPSVEELARPELRIAGLRINPNNFAPSRQNYINNLTLKNIKSNKISSISGLPSPLLASSISWSPNEKKIVFTQTDANRVDLYIIDVMTQSAEKINQDPLNVVLGSGIVWKDDNTLLYRTALQPASAAPVKPLMPKGPTIQQNLGKKAPSATYEDLIKSPYDERLFEFYATAQLVQNVNGTVTKIGDPAIYASVSLSPDRKYFLERKLKKPFSYLVPAGGFPSTVSIADLAGQTIKVIAELPSREGTPSGYDNVQDIPRSFDWKDDEAATVIWAKPLDSGLIKKPVDFHDAVYALTAPFSGTPKELFKTQFRYRGTIWGNESLAVVEEGLRSKQVVRISRYNSKKGDMLEKLVERNETDAYNDPGNPVTFKNQYGHYIIKTVDKGSGILMNNTAGSSPKGDLPFLAKFDLSTKKNQILWRSREGTFEYVIDVIDPDKLKLITRKESQKMVPNYFLRDLSSKGSEKAITSFANPYPQLDKVSRQKITYKRSDGVDLTGNLYLPAGYDKAKDGPLPVLIWAYPREFNSASDAAQIRGSNYRFTTISGGGPVFFVTNGYAVLDNAEMPIVSQGGKKPNDTFVQQLQLNAEAAINKLAEMGVGDRNRVAVGGHSYGAFMTANLLAHTNLFKAGIAQSGAYNRTLTPFGFQNEERTYWDAPQLYYEMSPFSFANKIKTPLLLIHGDSDDNPGTFPINSERLFNAVKGFGGTIRFVFLPHEAHGYRGRENLLHRLWEINQWLDKYVKNAK